ncbi:MAG: ATP-binding protein, partial [Bifidobacteriaceae bacterium]|nr:ATP-binding protein [Bifidobacteriaceae bacterium]
MARFTPSLLPKETLEDLFVGRGPLLDPIVGRIREAGETGRLAHTLLLGARGSGKTHLVSLAYHRARALPGFGERFTLSWLPEDPWAVTDFEALLDGIGRREEPGRVAGAIRVVLLENLDQVFASLGAAGQRQLRAWIERHEDVLLLATATRATASLVEQAAPFYGFFNIEDLSPFTVDDAVAMLQRIAHRDGDEALERRLGEPATRARLASIGWLTGGSPRIWALLAAGLNVDALGDLFEALVTTLDDLTPYYQEQLGRLS